MDTSHNYELQRDALIAKDRSLRYDTAAYSRAGILISTFSPPNRCLSSQVVLTTTAHVTKHAISWPFAAPYHREDNRSRSANQAIPDPMDAVVSFVCPLQ